MKNRIKDAYDSINISEESKNRIYSSLFSEKDEMPQNIVYIKSHRKKLLRVISIAVAVTVLVVFAATAVAETQYDLSNYIFKNQQSETDSAEVSSEISSEEMTPYQKGLEYVRKSAFMSITGPTNTPEHLANEEWQQYLESEVYDPDGSILDKVEAELRKRSGFDDEDAEEPIILTYDGIEYNYQYIYSCYTAEMCEKLDEICEKYSLKLINKIYLYYSENSNFADETEITTEDLLKMANCSQFIRESNDEFTHIVDSGYIYDDGSFHLEGTARLKSDEATWKKDISYQMIRTMKGTLYPTGSLCIGDGESYEQWNYTTSNGIPLLLARSEKTLKEYVIANLNDSYVVINVCDDSSCSEDYPQKTKRDLELFAETFDFASIS